MTKARVMVTLTREEYESLLQLALEEKRDYRDMGSHLIIAALEKRGLLQDGVDAETSFNEPKQWSFIGKGKSLEIYQDAIDFLGNLGYPLLSFAYDNGDGMIVVDCVRRPMSIPTQQRVIGILLDMENEETLDKSLVSH